MASKKQNYIKILKHSKNFLVPSLVSDPSNRIPTTIFVCTAIQLAAADLNLKNESVRLNTWISKSMQSVGTIPLWLNAFHPKIARKLYQTEEGFYKYRLAWIDQMIQLIKS